MTTPTADPLAALAQLPEVPEAVDRARAAVDRLRAHKVLRSRSAEVTAESALRGARASAALAGADWPLEELRRRTELGDEEGAGLVRGALRVSGELGSLLPILRQAPAQALSRMHMLAAAGEVDANSLARPRGGIRPGAVGLATVEPVTVEAVTIEPGGPALPVPADEAAERLATLAGILGAPSAAPAVVVAAVAYGELLAATPFGWGDGLVGRGLFRLLLAARGLDPQSLAVPEVGFVELGLEARTAALAAYSTGTAAGLGTWIGHCAEAVVRGAQESTAVCEAFMRG